MEKVMIPAEAVEAAWDKLHENPIRPIGIDYAELEAALEAAAPYIIADHLLTLAADVKARGDIGKDEGLESWDYLTWKAEQIRPTK